MVYALVDEEFPAKFLVKNPEYYKPGMDNSIFNGKVFWSWNVNGVIHSFFLCMIPVFAM